MGAVAVLGGIWEIVFFRADRARLVRREGEPRDAGLRGGNRRPAAPSHWDAFNLGLVRRPYGHEMITRLEHIGEPWQRKHGPCIPSRLTGRIIMASLYRYGQGSRPASIAPICSNPARGQ